jgi:hypothetical protein
MRARGNGEERVGGGLGGAHHHRLRIRTVLGSTYFNLPVHLCNRAPQMEKIGSCLPVTVAKDVSLFPSFLPLSAITNAGKESISCAGRIGEDLGQVIQGECPMTGEG